MTRAVKTSAILLTGLWLGILFCLGFVVAPYLFSLAARHNPAVPNTGVAADLIGPLLYSSDVISLVVGAGLLLTLLFLRRRGEIPLGGRFYLSEVGFAVAVASAAVNYWIFGPRIKGIQASLAERYGAFHLAEKTDPLLRQFNGLHQTSTALFMLSFTAVLTCLVCLTQFRPRSSSGSLGSA
jgi:hypothetical protein